MLTNDTFIQRAMQEWIALRVGATAEPLQNVRSIGFVAKFGETSLLATEVGSDSAANGGPIEVRTCRMRCMKADLIVVDSLARLYDCAEDEMLCHVLVVIGRGASVVTLLARNLVARNPNKVVPTSVIRHQPLAIHAFPDALCRPSTQQRRPERQHRNTNSSVSMMWGVCGNG